MVEREGVVTDIQDNHFARLEEIGRAHPRDHIGADGAAAQRDQRGIALGARTARTLLDRDPSKLAEPLDYVLSLADAGLAEMRALIFELRPESLEMEGLVAALTKQADSLRARHHLEINVVCGEEPPAPLAVKEALYRIAQEALHNIVKHAHARRVEVRLEWADEGCNWRSRMMVWGLILIATSPAIWVCPLCANALNGWAACSAWKVNQIRALASRSRFRVDCLIPSSHSFGR